MVAAAIQWTDCVTFVVDCPPSGGKPRIFAECLSGTFAYQIRVRSRQEAWLGGQIRHPRSPTHWKWNGVMPGESGDLHDLL